MRFRSWSAVIMLGTACFSVVVGQKGALNSDGTVASEDELARNKDLVCVEGTPTGTHLRNTRCYNPGVQNDARDALDKQRLIQAPPPQ